MPQGLNHTPGSDHLKEYNVFSKAEQSQCANNRCLLSKHRKINCEHSQAFFLVKLEHRKLQLYLQPAMAFAVMNDPDWKISFAGTLFVLLLGNRSGLANCHVSFSESNHAELMKEWQKVAVAGGQ